MGRGRIGDCGDRGGQAADRVSAVRCDYHDRGLCDSCTLIDQPYAQQLADKQAAVRSQLDAGAADVSALQWLDPVASAEAGFRNKAKMVVAGSVDRPTLGILDPRGRGIDLRECPLYPAPIGQALPIVAAFCAQLRLLPYDVPKGRGELKHVLVTASPDGELMLRFVLRSPRMLGRIREHLGMLLEALPGLRVVTANLQPEHRAVLEGPEEHVLTEQDSLRMPVNGIPLRLRPRSFFQTNTEVAAALYRQAVEWARRLEPSEVVDLYCGVGGFALHLAAPERRVHGVEISAEAVEAAREAAAELDLPDSGPGSASFSAGDATAVERALDGEVPLVVVNPPRRGLGAQLAGRLERSRVQHLIYSSCSARTLARDLAAMPSWRPLEARLLDMFPHTGHAETAVLLERR